MMRLPGKIPYGFLIFVTAYILRLAYVMEISRQPYFTAPAVDADYHDDWALDIAGGKLSQDQPFFRAPLYPFFLGAIYSVFGHNYYLTRIIQALIGSLTCVLVYLLGKMLFSRRVGVISGFVAAFTGIFIYFDGELLIPVVLLPLQIAMMLFLFQALESDRKHHWWLAGLFFGLCLITRPDIAIVFPLLLYLFLGDRKAKSALKRGGLFLLGMIIPILPVTYHNLRAGELVLIATQGGVNFYIGNNAEADGATSAFPGLGSIWRLIDADEQAKSEAGRELSASEISGFYYRKGFDFILRQPGRWLKLMANKFLLYLGNVEISNNRNIYFAAQDSLVLTVLLNTVCFGLYGPLGIVGLWLFFRKSLEHRVSLWFVLLYSSVVLMFFITARFRLPIVPYLIVFGVAGVEWFLGRIHRRDFKKILFPTVIVLLLGIFINSNVMEVQRITPAYAHFSLGNAYHKKNRLNLAEEEYLKAILSDPRYPQVHLNLGVIYYQRGQYNLAEQEFLQEIVINHGFETAFAFNNMGNIRLRQNNLEEAVYFYREALRIYPNYPDAIINLAHTYSDLGISKVPQDSLELAREYLRQAVELNGEDPMYRYNYGLVLGELGKEGEAVRQLEEALRINPDFRPAKEVLERYKNE